MGRLGGDEIGLVLFSGASFMQFPLTFDYGTARTFLESAGPEVISRPGTALGEAIETALAGFNRQTASQRVVLLMTDGEDHGGDALEAAGRAAEEGVVVYAVGFGSPEGEPIPEKDAGGQVVGFKKDERGEVVLSKLDEVTLQQIARETGGRYYRATADGSALDALASEIDSLQKASLQSEFETRNIERFQVFLAVALLALVVAELVPDRVTERLSWRWIRARVA